MPYSPDEFPQWTKDLRRAEVVAIGSLPFTLLYTGLVYDLGRFLVFEVSGRSDAANYAPWFFAPSTKPDLTGTEKLGIVLGSIGVSTVLALVDYVINVSERKKAESQAVRQQSASPVPGGSANSAAVGP